MFRNELGSMDRRDFLKLLGVAAGAAALGGTATACGTLGQSGASGPGGAWTPKNEITFIIPYAPGGATDPISRTLAAETEPIIKQKFVMVNKEGASGTVGTATVIGSKPDGYTVGLSSANALAFQPQVSRLTFNSTADYQPIIKVAEVPNVLAVRAEAPWKTFQEMVDDAKKRPGEITVGTSGRFSSGDMPVQDFMLKTGVKLNSVPYSGGGGEAMTALLGGHVDALCSTPLSIAPQVQAGKLRALLVFAKTGIPLFKGTPSSVESGYNVLQTTVYLVIGPKGLDKSIADFYYNAFSQAIKGPNFQKFAQENGFITDPIGPADMTKELDDWYKNYADLIRELKIEVKK